MRFSAMVKVKRASYRQADRDKNIAEDLFTTKYHVCIYTTVNVKTYPFNRKCFNAIIHIYEYIYT